MGNTKVYILAGIGLTIGLDITKLIIGAKYLHDCSIQKMVPIYLIVSALAPILFGGMVTPDGVGPHMFIFGIIGSLFNFAWVICGTAWVYPAYTTVHKDTYVPCNSVNGTLMPPVCTEGTCNDTLLTFSFAIVTLDWISIVILIFVIKYIAFKYCFQKKSEREVLVQDG